MVSWLSKLLGDGVSGGDGGPGGLAAKAKSESSLSDSDMVLILITTESSLSESSIVVAQLLCNCKRRVIMGSLVAFGTRRDLARHIHHVDRCPVYKG